MIIAVEDNKPDVIQKLTEIAGDPKRDPRDEVRVLALKSRYPQGAEKVLVQACTGRKVPRGQTSRGRGMPGENTGSISFLASYMRPPITTALLGSFSLRAVIILSKSGIFLNVNILSEFIPFKFGFKGAAPGESIK